LLSSFSKDVDSDSALKVLISGEWSHFSFHMERTVDVPSIIGDPNIFYAKKYIYIGKIRKFVSVSVLFSDFNNRCLTVAILTLSDKHLIETDLLKTGQILLSFK
jgi:hypothetical protein